MNIRVARHAGTCFGVENAIVIAFDKAREKNGRDIYIHGDLVHNPAVVDELKALGVKKIDDLSGLKEGDNLIIRAHGELKDVYDHCRKNKINIIDCTCPFVKKTQELAAGLEKSGNKVIIIGEEEHPEVKGIASHVKNPMIIPNKDNIDFKKLKKEKKLGFVSQTTQNVNNFRQIIMNIDHPEKKIHNTICQATTQRQSAAIALSGEVDTMVVIGGRNSGNTKRLYELCNQRVKTNWITDRSELKKEWFRDVQNIGVTAGASTPQKIIDEVVAELEKL